MQDFPERTVTVFCVLFHFDLHIYLCSGWQVCDWQSCPSTKAVCPYNVTWALVKYCMTVLHLVFLEGVSLSAHALNWLKAMSPVQSELSSDSPCGVCTLRHSITVVTGDFLRVCCWQRILLCGCTQRHTQVWSKASCSQTFTLDSGLELLWVKASWKKLWWFSVLLCWTFLYDLCNKSRIGWNAGYGVVGKSLSKHHNHLNKGALC